MKRLLYQILAAILGLWLAALFVSGVTIKAGGKAILPVLEITISKELSILLLAGIILGLMNYFLKPILKLIALPLQFLTLGLFTLVINMALVWVIDILFVEVDIVGIAALFWTTIIIWLLSFLISKF